MMEESLVYHHSPAVSLRITLHDLQIILGSMSAILRQSFGPKGQSTLLISNTGKAVLIKDGCETLLALHMAHPVAKMIQEGVKNFCSSYGDGAKTMVIYIDALLQALNTDVRKQTYLDSKALSLKNKMTKMLQLFFNRDLPPLLADVEHFIKEKMVATFKIKDISWILFHVVSTFLSGCISLHIIPQIAKVVMDYFPKDSCVSSKEYIESIKWFGTCVCISPTKSYANSHVDHGIFLERPLIYKDKEISSINLICMLCDIDGTLSHSQGKDICLLNDPGKPLHHRLNATERFLKYLQSLDISLVLTSSKVPQFALQLCQVFGVAVIDCVEETDIDFICYITRKSPITSCVENIGDNQVVKASSCHQYVEGQFIFSKLVLDEELLWQPRFIFLCAPTEALGKQLKEALCKCMIILSRLLNEDYQGSMLNFDNKTYSSPRPSDINLKVLNNIVCGGGYYEMVVCRFLCDLKNQSKSFHKRWCCEILQKMLLAVPFSLCQNLSSTSSNRLHRKDINIMEILRVVQEKIRFTDEICGLDALCQQSKIVDIGILEVLSVKSAILCSALSTATCLLNLDAILSTSRAVQSSDS